MTRCFIAIAAYGMLAAVQPALAQTNVCRGNEKPAHLNLTLQSLDGNAVTLSEFKGKVIILDFWATWCKACRTAVPSFVDLQRRYGKDGLQIVGISVDDTVDKLRPYVAEFDVNYPLLVGRDREDVMKAFAPIAVIPSAVVITREGNVCRRHSGETKMKVFEDEIKELL